MPPLAILVHLALTVREGLIVWVGRRCWPMPAVLEGGLARSILIDPESDDERFWAIDQALRCPGVGAVVADAGRLDMAGSRRFQLAAEAGGTLGLLARPAWERAAISAAETRWMVRPEPASAAVRRPRWSLELLRCKGASLSVQGRRWVVETVEVDREALALRVPADVERGPGAEEAPALRIA